jgi:molybdopterin molybdotransferase
LTVNLASQAGREDWWPVRLTAETPRQGETTTPEIRAMGVRKPQYLAEPIFGKSNLIFTIASADGLIRIHPDATGLSAGETVEVFLL